MGQIRIQILFNRSGKQIRILKNAANVKQIPYSSILNDHICFKLKFHPALAKCITAAPHGRIWYTVLIIDKPDPRRPIAAAHATAKRRRGLNNTAINRIYRTIVLPCVCLPQTVLVSCCCCTVSAASPSRTTGNFGPGMPRIVAAF